jgi:putative DNA primase/helicase
VTSKETKRAPFHVELTERIIAGLKDGTAPFIKPWEPGKFRFPYNLNSGRRYQGANMLQLLSYDYSDPRWVTYQQARKNGWQVREGESAVRVMYWQFEREYIAKDESGKTIFDANNNPVKVRVKLDIPKTFYAFVFNGTQVDGLPEYSPTEVKWDRHERAEEVLLKSRAKITHNQRDTAAYIPLNDEIIMPPRAQFTSSDKYYQVVLHELGHWTGHSSRLNRDLTNPIGSAGYAREELRAEIASMIIGEELGIGHDPQQSITYIGNWIRALEKDPREILRAARDAEHICSFINQPQLSHFHTIDTDALELESKRTINEPMNKSIQPTGDAMNDMVYFNIPYREKQQAKQMAQEAGFQIQWDKEKKLWSAPQDANLAVLSKWSLSTITTDSPNHMDVFDAFKAALEEAELIIEGAPVMDGRMHRVPVLGGKNGGKDGAYQGHLDQYPAGFFQNHKSGVKGTWTYKGADLSNEDKKRFETVVKEQRKKREGEESRRRERVSKRVTQLLRVAPNAMANHEYLVKKQVSNIGALKQDNQGRLLVPVADVSGKVWSVQRISANGFKQFQKGGQKSGMCHLVEGSLLAPDRAILIAEGYATASSIVEATRYSVYVAFDAYNLESVAKELRHANPSAPIFIMGDRDQVKGHNLNPIGQMEANRAAAAVSGHVVLPTFMKNRLDLSDWNDLYVEEGAQVVYDLVRSSMEVVLEAQQAQSESLKHSAERHGASSLLQAM